MPIQLSDTPALRASTAIALKNAAEQVDRAFELLITEHYDSAQLTFRRVVRDLDHDVQDILLSCLSLALRERSKKEQAE